MSAFCLIDGTGRRQSQYPHFAARGSLLLAGAEMA